MWLRPALVSRGEEHGWRSFQWLLYIITIEWGIDPEDSEAITTRPPAPISRINALEVYRGSAFRVSSRYNKAKGNYDAYPLLSIVKAVEREKGFLVVDFSPACNGQWDLRTTLLASLERGTYKRVMTNVDTQVISAA